MLINWRRGLFRVWLLTSAGWVMGWTIYLIMYSLQGGYSGNKDFVAIPILLLAPPLALLILGLATGWAFRGFQAEDHKRCVKWQRRIQHEMRAAVISAFAFGAGLIRIHGINGSLQVLLRPGLAQCVP